MRQFGFNTGLIALGIIIQSGCIDGVRKAACRPACVRCPKETRRDSEWSSPIVLLRAIPGVFYGALDFSGDGQFFAAADNRGVIYLWDAQSLKLIRQFKAHSGYVSSIRFDYLRGRKIPLVLYSVGEDGYLRKWDPRTSQKVLEWVAHSGPVVGLATDGLESVATVGEESGAETTEIKMWRADGGGPLWKASIASATFDEVAIASGRRYSNVLLVAVHSDDASVIEYDVRNGAVVGRHYLGQEPVGSMSISQTDLLIAIGSDRARIFELGSWRLVQRGRHHMPFGNTMAFHPFGYLALFAEYMEMIVRSSDFAVVEKLNGPSLSHRRTMFHPNGILLVSSAFVESA